MTMFEEQRIPWEYQKKLGPVDALWSTVGKALTKPGALFEGLDRSRSLWYPYTFYLILSFASFFVGILLNALVDKQYQFFFNPKSFALALVMFPFFTTAVLAALTVFIHAAVRILGGTGGLRATFHVMGYTAAASLCGAIPFVGNYIYFVWAGVIAVIGFKRVHRLATWRAVVACLAPFIAAMIVGIVLGVSASNLSSPRRNEARAQRTVRKFASAINAYALRHLGAYPNNEVTLKYAKPAYIDDTLDGKTVGGYRYTVRLDGKGYEIVAAPYVCGGTGAVTYTARTGGNFTMKPCEIQ